MDYTITSITFSTNESSTSSVPTNWDERTQSDISDILYTTNLMMHITYEYYGEVGTIDYPVQSLSSLSVTTTDGVEITEVSTTPLSLTTSEEVLTKANEVVENDIANRNKSFIYHNHNSSSLSFMKSLELLPSSPTGLSYFTDCNN